MRKVLITSRSFGQRSPEPAEILEAAGFTLEYYNETFQEEVFQERLADCEALIIGAHPLSEAAVQAAPKLKIVSKHGAGLDNIDLEMTGRYGIQVTRVPGVNAGAVADLTFSLMLDVARKVSAAAAQVRQGNWNRVTGVDVHGKSLSLIGFGEIGKNVARRARGFSMNVVAYDPFLKELPAEYREWMSLVTFEEALATADFLSIHVPLTAKTRGLIGAEELKLMKGGSFIINTSRGGIVEEEALYRSLAAGHTAGAGLDVLEQEPPKPGHPLLSLGNVTITPHMGMYSFEAINAVSLIAARHVVDYFKEEGMKR